MLKDDMGVAFFFFFSDCSRVCNLQRRKLHCHSGVKQSVNCATNEVILTFQACSNESLTSQLVMEKGRGVCRSNSAFMLKCSLFKQNKIIV